MCEKFCVIARALRFVGAAAVVLGLSSVAVASSPNITQIEEHWELVIGEPDAARSAPQATMVMSPDGSLEGQYYLFLVNYQSAPEYQPGGLQVQLWNTDAIVAADSSATGPLSQTNDTVQWVQRLRVEDGSLCFEVVDGSSNSWGSFGGDGTLSFSTPTTLENLNQYAPAISLTESQVGYAGNRVQRLLLKKLVWTTDDGESHELHAPIDIDADLDP